MSDFLARMHKRDPANDETVELSGYDFWRLVQLAEERDALQAMVDCCRDLVVEYVEGEEIEDGDDLHEALVGIVGYPPDYRKETTDGS